MTTIGVDVGGSGVKAALVDLQTGVATGRMRVETPQPATPDAIAKSVAELVDQLDTPGAIGCTLPAVVLNGVVCTAAHIDESWIGTNAERMMSDVTGRPCAVLNDADAAGLAEARFGAARDRTGVVVADTWVSDAARTNEELTWKRWSHLLERYLTHLHALLWPELIVVGGGVVKHADKFLDRIDVGCEVRIAELGNLAGIVGAALAAGERE